MHRRRGFRFIAACVVLGLCGCTKEDPAARGGVPAESGLHERAVAMRNVAPSDLSVFCVDSPRSCGYVDTSGRIVIPATFQSAAQFDEMGMALVEVSRPTRQGGHGFIDHLGGYRVLPVFSNAKPFDANGLAAAADNSRHPIEGISLIAEIGRWGFINRRGEWVIQPRFTYVGRFNQGLAVAPDPGNQGRYGFLKADGTWAIPSRFRSAGDFAPNGLAPAQEASPGDGRGARWGLIDKTGQWAVSPRYGFTRSFARNGLAPAYLPDIDRVGFIDATGQWAIPPKFNHVGAFSDVGLASAREELQSKTGYIDAQGRWAIPPRFDWAGAFDARGFAKVQIGSKTGLIDSKGAWLVEPRLEKIGSLGRDELGFSPAGISWVVDDGRDRLMRVDGTFLAPLDEHIQAPERHGPNGR